MIDKSVKISNTKKMIFDDTNIQDSKIYEKVERWKNRNPKTTKEITPEIAFDMSEFYFDGKKIKKMSTKKSPNWLNFCSKLSLSRKLLTEEEERRFNPMVISFRELGPMPSFPIPTQILEELCDPVSITFEAFDRKFVSRKGTVKLTGYYKIYSNLSLDKSIF